jgi:tetratricopeptide (TPR) repeat protein
MSTPQASIEPAIDPLHPLLRIIERYRRDVHQLQPPPSAEALQGAEAHISRPLPPGLAAFLRRFNGATLFRGALTIRSLAELAPASTQARSVIVFADGPADADHWAFVAGPTGGDLFGRWIDERFEPLHERFMPWLMGTVRILDENLSDPEAMLAARLDADPEGAWLLIKEAQLHLAAGDPDRAAAQLQRAVALEPGAVVGWMRLGDTQLGEDDAAARWSYLKALRSIQLPHDWPPHYTLEPTLIRTLGRLFPAGDDAWERELSTFLDERVGDVRTDDELAMVEAAILELSRVFISRGERDAARQMLTTQLSRVAGYALGRATHNLSLMLARIETDLGHHDDAERRLRALRGAPAPYAARASLVLGRIAMMRLEPWAEEILAEALSGLEDTTEQAEAALLLAERHLRMQDLGRAETVLGRAVALARQSGRAPLIAQSHLLLGDLAWQRQDDPTAQEQYQLARRHAGDSPELLQRILIRRGRLYERLGNDPERAREDYRRAAEEFAALSLPIREGWAWVSAAQVGLEGAAEAARSLFKAADLAAGVAAADAALGDPAASLSWHLERTAEHSRDCINARRARPPLIRADADRPERRIGAHRAAIAACGVSIVHALSDHLDGCVRALERASNRPTDPNLTRYVAAVDLLAAHRSYEAAEVLLEQLASRRASGAAGRALIGALARSSNAALVDGLLETLEKGGEASRLAAAAEVLGWRREPAAVESLCTHAAPGSSPFVRKAAIIALGRIGDARAIEVLLPALDEPELAEAAAVSLLLLGEWRGLDDQAQALATQRGGSSRSLGEIVGRYGGPNYLLLMMRTAEVEGPAGLGALSGLGYLGAPRVVERLIEATASRDTQRALVASGALEVLTGHHESTEESLLRNRWLEWWEQNSDRFDPGQRYRGGELMSPGLLITRMGHDDPLVRRACYDELVISTGVRLPFDPDGPWRVQVAHLTAWRAWWSEQGTAAVGRWTFHGEEIG